MLSFACHLSNNNTTELFEYKLTIVFILTTENVVLRFQCSSQFSFLFFFKEFTAVSKLCVVGSLVLVIINTLATHYKKRIDFFFHSVSYLITNGPWTERTFLCKAVN